MLSIASSRSLPLELILTLVPEMSEMIPLAVSPFDICTEDLVQMSNGDTAKGIISDISGTKVKINSNGSDLELAMDNIDWIYFAAAGKPKQQTERSFRVRLLDGSVLAATAVAFKGEELTFSLGANDQRK